MSLRPGGDSGIVSDMHESATRRAELLRRIGRASGIAGGGLALALWGLFTVRVAAPAGERTTFLVAAAMAALAAAAVVAAWAQHGGALTLLALLSLVPVGLYLLATPTLYAGIGIANLLCLAGGLLMLRGRRAPSLHA